MKIAVVGLGLMGGSICKALQAMSDHEVYGVELDEAVAQKALLSNAIDGIWQPQDLVQADVTYICLFPRIAIQFLLEQQVHFRPESIVTDICGVKQAVIEAVEKPLLDRGIAYVGSHPMAGRECSGFDAAKEELFLGASWILTPTERTPDHAIATLTDLARVMGCRMVVETTASEHDRIIAYTSQLAHVVSSAYVKSGGLARERGFSAGSFQDMTRVAKLDENMWASLFMLNQNSLLAEIDTLLLHLTQYREALAMGNEAELRRLLKEGRLRKEASLQKKE